MSQARTIRSAAMRHEFQDRQSPEIIDLSALSDYDGDEGGHHHITAIKRGARAHQQPRDPKAAYDPEGKARFQRHVIHVDLLDDTPHENSPNLGDLNHKPRAAEPLPRNLFMGAEFGGYIHDDLDINDPEVYHMMMEDFAGHAAEGRIVGPVSPSREMSPIRPQAAPVAVNEETPELQSKDRCLSKVSSIFPGICVEHVSNLYDTVEKSSEHLIAYILDQGPYPKTKKTMLKRKRELDEDEEAAERYGAADRHFPPNTSLAHQIIRPLLVAEFTTIPVVFIDATLKSSQCRLFSVYRVLEEASRTFDPANPPYTRLKNPRKATPAYPGAALDARIRQVEHMGVEAEILLELQAARRIRAKADARRNVERQSELEEAENSRRAEAEGTMSECGCCFVDYPINRMIHCNNEEELHCFCRGCALRTAEIEIGNSKYDLRCMCMDGCQAGFSIEQRSHFLSATTIIALERSEQEANLRMAGIENLASCPFCPFAAEYPPVEIDREFRCQAPDCEKISCRICNLESHIPKSCAEHSMDEGLSVRRQIEEAMTAALIRKCTKCGTPFVKHDGCNKMTCTRSGCLNIQCYVCSQSCDYGHFNQTNMGGKVGNCPLFDNVEKRHEEEVAAAERTAMANVRLEHPEYIDEHLKVQVSDAVQKDEEKRKTRQTNLYGPPRMDAFAARGRADYVNMLQHRINMGLPGYNMPAEHLPENIPIMEPRADPHMIPVAMPFRGPVPAAPPAPRNYLPYVPPNIFARAHGLDFARPYAQHSNLQHNQG